MDDHVLPFLDLQYLLGLARAGRPEADVLMARMQSHADEARPGERAIWQDVCLPAGRGLVAWARGDHAQAVRELGRALPRMLEIGGSHAQRDLFSQVHLDALIRSGHLNGAQNLLQPLVRSQPESRRLRRQGAQLYAALGLAHAAERLL
jgi:predicted Zn-dependent protease